MRGLSPASAGVQQPLYASRMTDQPKVSVVIATFNRAKLLRSTIESVLTQNFVDYELIIVDDGSTDNTKAVLEPYQAKIRYFYQENRGPSAARNVGVRQAKAPWIAIQDSDDLCAPNHLDSLYRYTREHCQYAMVFANGEYLGGPEHSRETIIPARKSRRLAQEGVQLGDLFEKSIVRLQAALISKDAYDRVGGHDESLRICMDLDLSFRLFMNYPIAYLDKVVFSYRKHDGNIGRNEDLRLTENIRVIQKLLRDYPEAKNLLGENQVRKRLAYRYYRLAKGRRKRNDPKGASDAIRKAVSIYPLSLKYRIYQHHWTSDA
jgi:glycosyltransferase involved in cell wall biosynthesis